MVMITGNHHDAYVFGTRAIVNCFLCVYVMFVEIGMRLYVYDSYVPYVPYVRFLSVVRACGITWMFWCIIVLRT